MEQNYKKLSIAVEENPWEAVWSFPFLYNKRHRGYEERDAVANAHIDKYVTYIFYILQSQYFLHNI